VVIWCKAFSVFFGAAELMNMSASTPAFEHFCNQDTLRRSSTK
jgi:hypothetical protein